MSTPTLDIRNLSVSYSTPRGELKALRNVSIQIPNKKIVGIVGESGCGKSTLISAISKLMATNATVKSGEIEFHNSDILKISNQQMSELLGTDISLVFQDPMQTHNPVLSIGRQMVDIQFRDRLSKVEKYNRASEMLSLVGIPDAEERLKQYPFEFSGGMRQRIAIAMALMAKPSLLIADEPTTALDATLEVQIIKRLRELQDEIGCSILFISHNLGVIAELCDEVVVMYAGEVVESGSVRDVFHSPAHPYTKALLECDPGHIKEKTRNLPTIPGEIPDLVNLSTGCVFAERCSKKHDACEERPQFSSLNTEHFVACHLTGQENAL